MQYNGISGSGGIFGISTVPRQFGDILSAYDCVWLEGAEDPTNSRALVPSFAQRLGMGKRDRGAMLEAIRIRSLDVLDWAHDKRTDNIFVSYVV